LTISSRKNIVTQFELSFIFQFPFLPRYPDKQNVWFSVREFLG